MKIIGIYGAGGFGREVMPLLRQQKIEGPDTRCVFIDDTVGRTRINGHDCMTFDEFLAVPADHRAAALAIGSGRVRELLAQKCMNSGVDIINIKADNCKILDEVSISEGAILCPLVTITSNVTIGRHFHANLYVYVAHDCVIGDYVTLSPRAMCSGNVHIEDYAYIGTGAILRQGQPGRPLVIGKGAVVGMGAVVTRDVPPGITVVGNPARPLVREA